MATARSGYHHGDLRDTLVRIALELAREHGAEAVVLREATRRAGVTPRAAYRHFADRAALLSAAAHAALGAMADTIAAGQAADPAAAAGDGAALLREVGLGYIRFALAEPGLFDVAFFGMTAMIDAEAATARGAAGRTPYEQLQDALATLVGEGRLAADRVPDAAVACWSGVHGFAALAALGPLRLLPDEAKAGQAERLVADLVAAVTGPDGEGGDQAR